MFGFSAKKVEINGVQVLDEIENAVYVHLKPLGFRRFGRTLHRLVSEDISQVVHFQLEKDTFCVNTGIRVPECVERVFVSPIDKKYYHEYECNIRSRLGAVRNYRETWFDLSKNRGKIIQSILQELDRIVIPAFEVLNSREAILVHRREYPRMDMINHSMILLEECMIYGHLGDLDKAKELFEEYYRQRQEEYEKLRINGQRVYLKKGERVAYFDQDITADKNGYVTLYNANHEHLDYLDELALKLGFRE